MSLSAFAKCTLFAGASSLMVGTSSAELLLYEGFDYGLGTSLDGQAGGSGWDANTSWKVIDNNATATAASQMMGEGLVFSDYASSGQAWVAATNKPNDGISGWLASRQFGSAVDFNGANPTIYMSVLFEKQISDQDDSRRGRVRIHSSTSDTSRSGAQVSTYLKDNNFDTALDDVAGVGYGGSDSANTAEIARSQVFMAIAEFTNMNASSNQSAQLWILDEAGYDGIKAGGITSSELSTAAITSAGPVFDGNKDILSTEFLQLDVGTEFGQVIQVAFDELKVATTLEAATSPIPEPTSMTLVGLSGAVVLLRPRRRA
jgi:hypothetical protein